MKALFWISIVIIIYTYIGYPLLIYIISRFYKKLVHKKYVYPTVSVIMTVYNEEGYIKNKLESLLNLDYPEERIEILIGLDGCTDGTEEIIVNSEFPPRMCFVRSKREGKPSMLNELVKLAKGEILVFTDARQRLDKNAIKELVKNFSDPKVGSVSAELYFEGEKNQTGEGMGLYWEYEKLIRKSESRLGSMLGATGALYAIRRELFPWLPSNLILDDVYIPMHIVQRGYRAIFDKKAAVFDRYSENAKEEFLRKTRTLTGNFQLFLYFKWLFNPFKSLIGWQFISHKFLRLLVPFLLMVNLASSYFLSSLNDFYRSVYYLQVVFYILAILGVFLKQKSRLCDVSYMFCVMNFAAVAGLYRFVMQKQRVTWEKN